MKNLFNNISQEEKNRILEMHSGKKNVISEQGVPTPTPRKEKKVTTLSSLIYKVTPLSTPRKYWST